MCYFRREESWNEEMKRIYSQHEGAFRLGFNEIGAGFPKEYTYYSYIIEGTVVGFGSICVSDDDNEVSVVVDSSYQRHGYGADIVRYLESVIISGKIVAVIEPSNLYKSKVADWFSRLGYTFACTSIEGADIFEKYIN